MVYAFYRYAVMAAEMFKILLIAFAFIFIAMLQIEERHLSASQTTRAALCDSIGNHAASCHGIKDAIARS